mmetsp:Transcript_103737/g.268506  ORF Transcript_103737/g.268506 Transcript_103737/m.268506 type:complete len:240 (+) Transcript_103737:523-1242(+)
MRPAAVSMATVADPCAIRISIAKIQAMTTRGICISAKMAAKATVMPEEPKTFLKTPPAPVMRMMIPAGPRAFVESSSKSSRLVPRRVPKTQRVSKVDSSSAATGWPKRWTSCCHAGKRSRACLTRSALSEPVSPAGMSDVANCSTSVLPMMSKIGMAIKPMIVPTFGSSCSCSLSLRQEASGATPSTTDLGAPSSVGPDGRAASQSTAFAWTSVTSRPHSTGPQIMAVGRATTNPSKMT